MPSFRHCGVASNELLSSGKGRNTTATTNGLVQKEKVFRSGVDGHYFWQQHLGRS